MATHGLPDWPWVEDDPDTLPAPERLLLDALRTWQRATTMTEPAIPALRILLAAEGAEDAAIPIDALLRSIPQPRIACPLCPRVAPGEAALLLLCALAQRGARSEALAAALRLLPLRTAYAAMPPSIMTGATLRKSGLLLRHRLRDALRPPVLRG